MTPVHSLVRLPRLRCVMVGCKWKRAFDVRKVALTIGRRPRYGLVVDLFPDVHERVIEEIRDGLPAMWSDVRERLGLPSRSQC